jgi:hypothetical protein
MFRVFHTYVASVLCCTAGSERIGCVARQGGGGLGYWGPADGVLWSGRAGDMLVLNCSSQLLSAARIEREEEFRGDRRAQRQSEVRAWVGEGGRGRVPRPKRNYLPCL